MFKGSGSWGYSLQTQTEVSTIREVLDQRLIRMVFQPVVDLSNGSIFSYEALVRGTSNQFPGPPSLLSAAVEGGVIGEFGRLTRELAVENCPDYTLFLNLHPAEFGDGWLVRPDDPMFEHPHEVYLEVTESAPLTHFEQCFGVLAEVRSKGLFVAIDDLGAGYSNLKSISDLQPEIVKLDMALIQKLPDEPRQQKLVAAIVRLCHDLGSRVVCEGIETQEELRCVQDSGAEFGQGYLLARPNFPPPPVDMSLF